MPDAEPAPENEGIRGHIHEPSVPRHRTSRQLLTAGATLAALGITLSLGSGSELAGAVFVPGIVVMLLGLHRVGRDGPG